MHITAAEFEAKCMKIMDEIAQTREPVVITKSGKPIAKLVPPDEPPKSLFGYMQGTFEIVEDIVDTPEIEWNAMKDCDAYEDVELYECLASGPQQNSDGFAESEEKTK